MQLSLQAQWKASSQKADSWCISHHSIFTFATDDAKRRSFVQKNLITLIFLWLLTYTTDEEIQWQTVYFHLMLSACLLVESVDVV